MMAPDSGYDPPSQLREETIVALRASLREYVADGSASSLSQSLLHLAGEARERHVPPEQVLVVLKDVWHSMPEVRAMTDVRQQARLLERLVTMCIKEYYST